MTGYGLRIIQIIQKYNIQFTPFILKQTLVYKLTDYNCFIFYFLLFLPLFVLFYI